MELDYEHGTGRHCGSTSLANLSRYYGWDLDEPTCFGLASGLGFTYFTLDEPPTRAFFGRPLYLEGAFFETLDVPHEDATRQDWETARDRTRAAIDDGHPVMLFTDIYYLEYFDTDTHFAPHSLLAVGYDDEGFWLSDSEFPDLQHVPYDDVRAATGSTHTIPLSHRTLRVTESDPDTTDTPAIGADLDHAVVEATKHVAAYMLSPADAHFEPGPWGTHGLGGIQRLVMETPEWTTFSQPRWTARFAYQNVDRRGTGGGAFRGLMRDFFRAVDHPFDGATDEMAAIADDWSAVGELFREASETDDDGAFDDLLREASGDLSALADREARLYESILEH